jgi:hypothetical protein
MPHHGSIFQERSLWQLGACNWHCAQNACFCHFENEAVVGFQAHAQVSNQDVTALQGYTVKAVCEPEQALYRPVFGDCVQQTVITGIVVEADWCRIREKRIEAIKIAIVIPTYNAPHGRVEWGGRCHEAFKSDVLG